MRQRGRPRRSSMPAVAHNKILDCPYSRQQQSPPEQEQPMQHYYNNNGGQDSGGSGDGGDEEDSQQLSDRYSRIQLVDQWPHQMTTQQYGTALADTSAQQHYFPNDEQKFAQIGSNCMDHYHEMQQLDDAQLSQEDDEDEDDDDDEEEFAGPSDSKRKRAFSFSSAPSSSTTNTMTTSSNTTTGHMEKRPATKICRVCGDKAYSYNFNVITCESCKAFFRRNANKEKEIRCPFNEQCDINVLSRRFCQRCRLEKCFRVGMKKEWIMSEEARLEKKQRIQENRERRAAAAAADVDEQQQSAKEMVEQSLGQPQHFSQQDEAIPLAATVPLPVPMASVLQQQHLHPGELHLHHLDRQQPTENLPSAILIGQTAAAAATTDPMGLTNSLGVLPNPFGPPPPSATLNTPAFAATVAANSEQAMAVAHQVAVAAQACAVQQAVNQAAAAVLLHHHQQQQAQQNESDFQQLHAQHEPSPMQELLAEQDSRPPPIVAIPVVSSTSIAHSAVASGELAAPFAAPESQMMAVNESVQTAALAAAAAASLQAQQPLLATAGLIPAAAAALGQQQQMPIMMASTAHDTTAPAGVLPPAVAAALIHQQQQHNQQQMQMSISPLAPAAPPANEQIPAATINSAQQHLNSQMAAAQQQLAEHQQQAAAAVAVAQLQQQAHQVQAQQQAAQIVAHAQQIQMEMVQQQQQQQQLAAFANAAAVHHQQQQNGTHQTASLLASTGQQQQPLVGTLPAETVSQHLQQMANALTTGSLAPSANANATTSIAAPPAAGGVLPSFMEMAAAAHLAAQPAHQPPSVHANPPTAAPSSILPALIPSAQPNLLIQQQQPQAGTPPQGIQQTSMPGASPSAGSQVQHCQQQQSMPPSRQEMVSIPRDVLMKLVEQRLEAERSQLQTPTKCQCHCQCGRYPSDTLIVDKVMADLLEGSSKHVSNGSENQSSSNSTPRLSQQFQPGHFQPVNSGQAVQQQQNVGAAPLPSSLEAMDTSSSQFAAAQDQLSAADQEQLLELAKANEVWKSSAAPLSASNEQQSVELQFLMGHYTESDLRRLIGVAKALEPFKRLEQHDQEILLKGCFGGFFLLRSLLSLDTSQYNLAMMRQNGVPEAVIRFYAEFPDEWRQNETVNLLLGMVLLFNVECAELQSPISVTVENMKFRSLLKRLLLVFCDRDTARAEAANGELMARLEQLKHIFPASNAPSQSAIGGLASIQSSQATIAQNETGEGR